MANKVVVRMTGNLHGYYVTGIFQSEPDGSMHPAICWGREGAFVYDDNGVGLSVVRFIRNTCGTAAETELA